nr:endonuclease iii like [Quercus suber]
MCPSSLKRVRAYSFVSDDIDFHMPLCTFLSTCYTPCSIGFHPIANMRTSRVSQETAKLAQALSPLRRFSTRQSLRQSETRRKATAETESDLSSPPRSPSESDDASSALGKRKRESAATPATTISASSTAIRQSPRKVLKPDPDGAVTPKRKKARRQPAKHIKGPNGDVVVEPPANWERMYEMTAEMRKHRIAAVDTMGCESLADDTRSPLDKRLQTLIALMLSSQTKDPVTAAAIKNLQDNLDGGFNLQALLDVPPERLNELIAKVGFHNNKTKYIKSVAPMLRDQFNGDIPDTIEGLISLPGVGPKMAYLTMSSAWGRDEGIGVDVHVHRITNLWGWHKTSTPEQTRAELESWLPREKWHDINHLLVGFGQTYCLPVGRNCGECDLMTEGLCPSAVAPSPAKKRAVKKEKVEVKIDNGEVVKQEEVLVESDDVGVKVEADLQEDGKIEMVGRAGDV